ncbi:MAG: flagellar biosynthesis protein FlhF [Desulfobacteraceae bacterium 4572_130]|nr:MAG: flagellar biosynthesis protein FlhF [Desulfobacteraceae bacterium 4572_130]
MKTRIFKAQSIQNAVARIKKELGSDAMILSSRKVSKSPRDPYSKEIFEVEAVLKDQNSINNKIGEKESDNQFSFNRFLGPIKEELVNIKDIISLVGLGTGMESMICKYPEAAALFASLLRTGISEKRVNQILQKACFAMENENNMQKDSNIAPRLKEYVIKEYIKQISIWDPFIETNNSNLPHIAVFVGPTGVGKTTTIAKLAAELSLKRKKKVGLISIDTYRIGAFEQLKVYASIMGLMCVSAFSKNDFLKALGKMKSMDIVLVDTAGHSHLDSAKMNEAAKIINGDFKISVHLVLSVTTGFMDMKKAANSFAALKPESYVFTKIDETQRCGKIIDQVSDLNLPVSIITNGQRVPEDLIIPDERELLGVILGTEQGGEK